MKATVTPLALFLLALAVRALLMLGWSFDGLYGQDAFAYWNCAREITQLHAWQVPCLDFSWPLGYPSLAALLMKLVGRDTGAQWASLLTGAALAPLTYGIARLCAPAGSSAGAVGRAALAAGLLAACGAQLALSSLVVMSDVAALFWASLAVFCALRYARAPQLTVWLPALALALGAAIASRWVFAVLAPPLAIFVVRVLRHRRPLPRVALGFSLLLFGAICGVLLYQNAHSPAQVTHHAWVLNWDLRSAWRSAFDNPDGHFSYRVPPALFYAAPLYHPLFLPVVLLPFAALGAWRLRGSPAGWLLGAWAASMYVYFIGVPYENLRFALAYLTPCLVFAALGLFLDTEGRTRLRVRLAVLLLALAISAFSSVRGARQLRAVVDRQAAAIAYLRTQAPGDATVVSFGLSISLQHYTSYSIVDLYAQTPDSLRGQVCGRPALLFIDRDNLRQQWRGYGPESLVEWLENTVGTEPIGAQDNWQLFRVRQCRASASAAGVPATSVARGPRSGASWRTPA